MSSEEPNGPPAAPAATSRPVRREATAAEAKALAHPLRLRILRLCVLHELTNKELADRLDSDPATVLYHVRLLVAAGLLTPAPVRTGKKGALEKPYRSTGLSWWLDDPLGKARDLDPESPDELRTVMWDAFGREFREAGPDSLSAGARFILHLTPEELAVLERRLLDVLDEYVATDQERRDRPVYNGLFLMHRIPDA